MRRQVGSMGVAIALAGCQGPVATSPSTQASTVTTASAVAAPMPSPVPTPRVPPGLLVPLYQKPSGAGWSRLIDVKRRHPGLDVVAVVNPEDGASWGVDAAYTAGIATLHRAGVVVLGYVYTGYGERAPASVKREATRWHDEYPLVDGIFFDEMATEASTLDFYRQAASDVHQLGYETLFGNFGVAPPPALAETVDVAVTFEASGLPDPRRSTGLAPAHQAMLGYGDARLDALAVTALAERYRYLYVTDDDDPDPWDTMSGHLEALADLLDPPAREAP